MRKPHKIDTIAKAVANPNQIPDTPSSILNARNKAKAFQSPNTQPNERGVALVHLPSHVKSQVQRLEIHQKLGNRHIDTPTGLPLPIRLDRWYKSLATNWLPTPIAILNKPPPQALSEQPAKPHFPISTSANHLTHTCCRRYRKSQWNHETNTGNIQYDCVCCLTFC